MMRASLHIPAPAFRHLSRRPSQSFSAGVAWTGKRRVGSPAIRCSKGEPSKDEHQKEVITLKEQLLKSGLTKEVAEQVLSSWKQDVGHEVTPDDLRKVLIKSSTRFTGYVLLQALLDAGAAYGAFVGGDLLGQTVEQYGFVSVALQAVAYILAGYYATGVFFDLFKLSALVIAVYQFNVNSATFLEAVTELAGTNSTGLNTLDKAREAVNMVKVLQGLNSMSDLLQKEQASGSGPDMLRDLGAYLTLDKAQRSFGFDAAKAGLTESQAVTIAVVFSKFDTNDDGVLSLDEFKRLCLEYAPELSAIEVEAGFKLLDSNGDQQIEFREFVPFWMKKLQLPAPSEQQP